MAWSARNGNYWQVGVSVWIESQTDKTATVVTQSYFRSNWRINVMSSIRWSMAWNGKSGSWWGESEGRWIESENDATVVLATARETVNKGGGWTYSGSASVTVSSVSSGTRSVSASVWIPAQTLRPPSAPSNLIAQRTAAGVIGVTWRNNASNASSTSIERCPYGGSWAVVSSPGVVTSYSDSVGTGTYKYRVRYRNGDGWSGYSNESEWVTALCAPAAPTCVLPASGATHSANAGRPLLQWRHNPLDTSAQTAAEVKWTFDGWTTEHVASVSGSTSSLSIDAEPNTDAQWRVRTKGAYDGDGDAEAAWSPWSGSSPFRVRTPPSVSVVVDHVVAAVPLEVSWVYEDAMGVQVSASVVVFDSSGSQVYAGSVQGAATSLAIPPSEFTPIHLSDYAVEVTVVSTTSLQAQGRASTHVEYEPPAAPGIALSVDEESARVKIAVYDGGGEVPASHMAVFRNGEPVASGLYSGQSVSDDLPPLDAVLAYRVVAYASSGAVSEATREIEVRSLGRAYFDFDGDQCRMRYDMEFSDSTKGERVTRTVAGAKRPKVFFGEHEERSGSFSALVRSVVEEGEHESELDALNRLKAYNGIVCMRRPEDDPLWVVCDVSVNRSYAKPGLASVSVSWEAVEP